MAPEFNYTMAFLTGLLASGHCIGMCGGLVSAFFMRFGQGRGPLPYLVYHGARIGVYTLIGIVAASLGLVVQTGLVGKVQGVLEIVAGLIVTLLGLNMLGMGGLRVNFGFLPMDRLRALFMRSTQMGPVAGTAIGGMLNGLMPCPITMAVAVKATTATSLLQGGGFMLALGLGTLPSMLLVSVLFGRLGAAVRSRLLKAAAVVVIFMGLSTLWQGITYLRVMGKLANW